MCGTRRSATLKLASLADSRFHDSAPHPLSPPASARIFANSLAKPLHLLPFGFPLPPPDVPPLPFHKTPFSIFFPPNFPSCFPLDPSLSHQVTTSQTHTVSPDTIPHPTCSASPFPHHAHPLTFLGPSPSSLSPVRSPTVRYLSPHPVRHPFGDDPGNACSTSCARTTGCLINNHARHHLIIHDSSGGPGCGNRNSCQDSQVVTLATLFGSF